ncbi:D-alanyl-D-alanine carboxypeptidase [bacterium 210820-DFI.6.37]|nr:D-alanyl-D-alanine carboxypeptidase [bacterium 210820-DFI.6.37]
MKFKKKLCILITILAIACAQGAPAFAASADSLSSGLILTAAETAKEKAGVEYAVDLGLEAEAAIVMDADTGKILYEKDSRSKREPASTTKIVTCMLALEHLDLDQVITVKHDAQQMGSIINVKKGEKIRTEDLLYALMLPSANDAAVALAEEIGGTVENFCEMMDEKAKECGAENTHFRNPNGLNWQGQEDHLTTAYDLAVIAREAMKNSTFRKLVSTTTYTMAATNKSKERKLLLTNKLLWDDAAKALSEELSSAEDSSQKTKEKVPAYEGAIGVKTGLTSTAGGCFVGAVERNGAELISVVLHSGNNDRFFDTIKLWDYTFENFYKNQKVIAQGEKIGKVRVKRGAHRHVKAVAQEDILVTVPKDEDVSDLKTDFEKLELRAPVKKGDKIGTVKIYNGDKLLNQVDVLAGDTIEEGGPLSAIGIPDWLAVMIYIAAGLILLMILVIYLLGRRPGSKRSRRKAARAKRERRRARK